MRSFISRAPTEGVFTTLVAALCLWLLVSSVAEAAPSISGSPRTSIRINSWYSFLPAAADPQVAAGSLRFTIANQPSWAQFSAYTGRLEGIPTQAGTWSNIRITVRSATGTATLPAFSISASTSAAGSDGGASSGGGTSGPSITGAPRTSIRTNSWYSFTPSTANVTGTLRFSIANRPSWATFSTSDGKLTGVPTTSSTWSNIRITVAGNNGSATLPAFSITSSPTAPGSDGSSSGGGSAGGGGGSVSGPSITGSPRTSIRTNSWYSFTPTAANLTGTLRYSIVNRPSWATFNTSRGVLSGVPTSSGTWSNIRITVTGNNGSATLPAFSITSSPTAPGSDGTSSGGGTTNRPPTISGSPASAVLAGNSYSFRPSAADPEGRSLSFSIQNRPGWASFNSSTGQLSGTPNTSQVGTYSNIIITVSDGTNRTSLPAFAITVTDSANGSASLSWSAPTRNTNGTALTNLAGYRIHYGTSANNLNRTVQVSNPSVTNYVVPNLTPATWYFSVRAYTTAGVESALSNTATKTVR